VYLPIYISHRELSHRHVKSAFLVLELENLFHPDEALVGEPDMVVYQCIKDRADRIIALPANAQEAKNANGIHTTAICQ